MILWECGWRYTLSSVETLLLPARGFAGALQRAPAVCECACFFLNVFDRACITPVYHTVHASVCTWISFVIVLLFPLRGEHSLILGGSLGAMTSDASQSNNIQGVDFYNIPSLLVLKPLEHCSAHFHTYCLFCLLWMHLYQDPSQKESVFFKTYLTAVNTAEMPLWSDFSQRQNVFCAFLKHTHLQRNSGAVNLQHWLPWESAETTSVQPFFSFPALNIDSCNKQKSENKTLCEACPHTAEQNVLSWA